MFQENPAKREEHEKKLLEEKRKKLQEETEQLRLKEETRVKKKTVKVVQNGWVSEKTQITVGDKPIEEEKPKEKQKKKNKQVQQQQVQKKKVDPAVQLERDIEKIALLNPFAVAEGVTGDDITEELYERNYAKGRDRGELNNLVQKELLKKQQKNKPNKPQANQNQNQNKPKAKPQPQKQQKQQNKGAQNQPTKQLARKSNKNQKSPFSVVNYLERTQLMVGAGLFAAIVLVYSVVIGGI